MPTPSAFVIEVDWDDNEPTSDPAFGGTHDNLTADVLAFSCVRGKDDASQLEASDVAGDAIVTLLNRDGKYSSLNASSPLTGLIRPGLKLRIRATAPTAAVLWTGLLNTLEPRAGAIPTALLRASGIFTRLGDQANLVSAGPLASGNTDDAIDLVLDAAGHPAGDRDLDVGVVPIANWYVEETQALRALQELKDTEIGRIREGLAWDVVFEGRYDRLLSSAASQGIFSDAVGASLSYLVDAEQAEPIREIYNLISATVTPVDTGSLAVLWTLSDVPFTLVPGQSITYFAQYTAGRYVDPWTTPVVGTDVIQSGVANGDIGVAVSKFPRAMKITLTNNHASASASITTLQARGVPVTDGDPFIVSAEDTTSQSKYGRRKYPLSSPWHLNGAFAQAACDYFVALKKDPHPFLRVSLPASSSDTLFAHAVQRDLSQRITLVAEGKLTKFGINQDFFIERIEHEWEAGGQLITSWLLSPAEETQEFWVLDVSELGINTRLAF